MDEVSAEAKLAGGDVASPLVVSVPRLDMQRAIDEEQDGSRQVQAGEDLDEGALY